jgi:small multidrug resistance pump
MMWFYVSLLVGILLGVAGQLLLKAGADGDTLLAQYVAPQSIAGLTLYFAAALCYMFALRRIPVSVAFPAVSLSYAVVVLVAHWTYGEPVGWRKAAGVLVICGGVFLVTR